MIRLALLLFPLLEIAGFILVGRAIGIVPTLGLVIGAAVVGLLLIRRAGLAVFREARLEMNAGRDPGGRIVRGFLTVLAGILLIVPGFLTDFAALALLLPPVHRGAWNFLRTRVRFAGGPSAPKTQPRVIDLERTDYATRPDPQSPWASKG